uniref:Tyrosine-protein kinase receptor n=1 Tax=Magallana gigas TaxID=29159 RepID=A0A8W8HUR7_MAGGI
MCQFPEDLEVGIVNSKEIKSVSGKTDASKGKSPVLPTEELPEGANCDFEVDLCGWHNVQHGDELEWIRHKNSTPTLNTGPSFDHTKGNGLGHYLYVEMDHGKHLDAGILESPIFPAPDASLWNSSSLIYGKCQLAFYYHMFGYRVSSLSVSLVSVCGLGFNTTREILRLRVNENKWKSASVSLTQDIPREFGPYFIQFKAFRGLTQQGDIAIDDISLSRECFSQFSNKDKSGNRRICKENSKTTALNEETTISILSSSTQSVKHKNGTKYKFNSCNAFGSEGPIQSKCNSVYKSSKTVVQVLSSGYLKGVQQWTVPENGTYEIHASGAAGGNGVWTMDGSVGTLVGGLFHLSAGEHLYILVGQKGSDACTLKMPQSVLKICEARDSLNSSVSPSLGAGGGGGGGGASFVFRIKEGSDEIDLLMVAGGGGGLAHRNTYTDPLQLDPAGHKFKNPGQGYSGFTNPNGAGGGGGWRMKKPVPYRQAGKSLLEGATGGQSCEAAHNFSGWDTPGGFGGGGGACSSGGGGGGYSGGNASSDDSRDMSGQGGSSYVFPLALKTYNMYPGSKSDGYVEIQLMFMKCQCTDVCHIKQWDEGLFQCSCMADRTLNADGYTCSANLTEAEGFEMRYVIYIAVASTIFITIMTCIGLCLIKHHRKRLQLDAVRIELQTASQNFALHSSSSFVRNGIHQHRQMVTEYNPNYDFVAAKYPEQQLNELNRNRLELVRALGQGAFGEVYKGYILGFPNMEREMAVAVKTLPAYSTEASELDFLMEAVIMSKFNHPNIVKLVGVCFESHPRYIVLELLEGGDLKTFLREMRPKTVMGDPLVRVSDLLSLADDIAKGCQHLEERHFIHRDIAARNCLLTCKGKDRVAKIADFGMARDIYRSDYYRKGGKALLPIKWMPPEAFLDGIFTSKTDVWSFGVLLWEIFSIGYMPYPGRTNHDVMQYVTNGGRLEPPEKCPKPLYDLMCECWATNPDSRPTFTEILKELKKFSQCPQILTAELPKFFMVPFQSFSPTSRAHSVSEDESELTPDSDTTEPLLTPRYQGSLRSSKKSASPKDSLKCPSLRVNLQTDSSSCDKKTASRDPFPSLCDITSLCENEYETHTSDSRSQATAAQATENNPLVNLPQFNGSN